MGARVQKAGYMQPLPQCLFADTASGCIVNCQIRATRIFNVELALETEQGN